MSINKQFSWLPYCLLLSSQLVFASSSKLVADYASLVVEGTITKIHAPLSKPDCVANCQPVPNFTFKIEQIVFGNISDSVFTIQRFVFAWPMDLVPYKEGEHSVLLMQRAVYNNELSLLEVLPAGRDKWTNVHSRDELKQQIKNHLIAQLSENPDTLKQAELIHTLSVLLSPTETEKLFSPFVTSSEKWVRHAAIGALVCKDPTGQNIELAKRDIEPTITEAHSDFIVVGTLSMNGNEHKTYDLRYYDCLGLLPKEKPLADLWHWIEKQDREKNPNVWPNSK